MSASGLTQEQARAAHAPGSVAVLAGAGTGKTKMLAHRYLHHLERGMSPLEVVAVTFTEKAADELRSRIRDLVRAERPTDRKSRVEIDAAQISTIHALAARICRDHPDEAQVAPDFTVLDAIDGALWHAEQLEEAITVLPEEVHAAIPVYLLRTVLGRLLEDPLSAEPALARGPGDWRALLEAEHEAAYERIATDPKWQDMRSGLAAHVGDPGDRMEMARRTCLLALDALAGREPERALELVSGFDLRGGKKDAWPGGSLQLVKEAVKAARDALKEECESGVLAIHWGPADEAFAELLPHLRLAYEQAAAHFEAAKRTSRVLSFSDLEVHALRALTHEHVREHYRRRWRAVLVDEFQDTNPVQARILEHLWGDALFTVVGDEKQSIYGFRGADVAVFRRFRDRILAAGGEEVVLTRTFRAHGGLTRTQDPIFRDLLRDLHQPLEAARGAPAEDDLYVQYHACVGKATSRPRRLNEAFLVAQLVRELVDSGTLITDPSSGEARPIRYGDVAVLARGSAPFETFATVLPSLGVPAVDVAGGDLLGTREATDAEAALRFFADQADAIALAAVLRSPFFAVDDTALLAFARTIPKDIGWWDHLCASDVDDLLARAREVLRVVLGGRWDDVPSRLLQRLDDATGYSAVVANLPGGRRRLADWRAYLGVVRDLEGWHRDVFTVVRQLRRLRLAGVQLPRPTLQAGDAVTLTTIHRSKGLEWPVVFVADLSYEGGRDDPSLILDAEHGFGLRLTDPDGEGLEPVVLRLLAHRSSRAAQDESRRLLYVALTRARERLYLTTSQRDKGNMALLEPALVTAGIDCREVPLDEALAFPDPRLPTAADHGLASAAD